MISTKTNGFCWGRVLAESDSESAPSWTPTKMPKEKEALHVKTLEEIRLEKIQAESAAYWEGIAGGPMAWEAANPAANPSCSPCSIMSGLRKPCNSSTNACSYKKSNLHTKNVTKELDFQVLTLDEIRKNRARRADSRNRMDNGKGNLSSQTNLSLNGHPNKQEDCKSYLTIPDLRSKLSSVKPYDKLDMSNATDSFSSKRPRQISPQSGPNKKQRIRLRRLSEIIGDKETGEKLTGSLKSEDGVNEELDSDNNFIGDIDKLLMELE